MALSAKDKEWIKECMSQTLEQHGLYKDDTNESRKDLEYLRKVRLGSVETERNLKRAAIFTFVSASAWVLYKGVQAYVKQFLQ